MSSRNEIWVVIVTYNSVNDVVECLKSIDQNKFNVVVVDNASTDKTISRVNGLYPKVITLQNSENMGFASGVNRGVRVALKNGANYVAVLNPDTVVKDLALETLVQFLSKGESWGVAGPAIEHKDFVSGKRLWDLGGDINWLLGRATHINVNKRPSRLKPAIRDYVSGCCMVIKAKVFFGVGLFDERFFMYYEDDDFCTRVMKAGFTVWNVPSVVVFHKFAQSSGWLSSISAYHLTRSALMFGKKWLSFPRRTLGFLWILLQCVLFSRTRISAGTASLKAVIETLLYEIHFLVRRNKIVV